ncbi:MAG: TolC family protein [candidate division Zixibacteria bacterium]|nr:TolC family protein [candidate division Zixibacteria bacterium]
MKIVEELRLITIAIVAFMILLSCIQTVEAQTISLDEYLTLVKQNNPFFVSESLSVEISVESQARHLGDKDWLAESSPFISYDDRSGLYNTTYNKSSQIQINGSLQKRVWKTGGRFSMSYTSSYSDQDYRTLFSGNPSELFRQQLSVTYSHPLLKNQGGVLDRLEYELAAFVIDFTEVQSQENQENFLLSAGISFLDWILMEEQLRINKERLLLAEEELKSAKEKFEAHLIDKVDVLRQEDALRIAEQNVVLSQSLASAKQTELAIFAQSPSIADSKPDYDIYAPVVISDIEGVIGRLNAESRLLRAIDILVDQTTMKTEGLTSQTRPQLDLNLGTVLIEDDESYGKSFGVDNPSLFVGLQFTYPLGNHTTKADIKRSEIELQQLKSDQKSIFLDLEASIRGITIQIKEMERVLELNLGQIESAQERTREETKIYEQGRGDMTFVIQSQDNEANARLTYLQNAVAYHKLVLQYRALLDQLLDSE